MYIPTEIEFRELFKLGPKSKVPVATRKQFARYVKGSHLLYKEISNIRNRAPMVINFMGKKENVVCYLTDDSKRGWQTFVDPSSGAIRLECAYIDQNRSSGSTPFWTYTKFEKNIHSFCHVVYTNFENELLKIRSKYNKYHFEFKWKNWSRNSG